MLMPRSSSGEGNGTPLQYFCLENPWTEEPGGLQPMGSLRVGHDWATSLSCIGEGNGNPLQCSCLENPRDGGAWWAAVCGVTQSLTRLKRLSSRSPFFFLLSTNSYLTSETWFMPAFTGGLIWVPRSFFLSCWSVVFFFNWMKDSLNSIVCCCCSVAKAYIY